MSERHTDRDRVITEVHDDGQGGQDRSTVWRVTLAWPETSETGRQERVDGLQQFLSTRAIVGLMGPGRPSREGLVVDLVLPVEGTNLIAASRGGELAEGPDAEDFAWELHRFTGAVVVNGDVASGDFAVVAADDELEDGDLAGMLDEQLQGVLLLGTVGSGALEEAADRLGVNGWLSDGDRPALAASDVASDPTMLAMPGETGPAIALRERPGRIDLLVWNADEETEPRKRPRRRRSRRESPVVETTLGAPRRAVALPEFLRPEGSDVAALLTRVEDGFASVNAGVLAQLQQIFPAGRVQELVRVANGMHTLGHDQEAGVLAPMEDGLMPGEEPVPEPEPQPHADLAAILQALGEDPAWVQLFDGAAPVGRSARPLGSARQGLDAQRTEAQEQDALERRRAAGRAGSEGGFETQLSHAPSDTAGAQGNEDFLTVLAADGTESTARAPQASGRRSRARAGRRAAAAPTDGRSSAARRGPRDRYPEPTPAAGTPASSAGADPRATRRRRWPVVLLVVGVLILLGAGAVALLAPQLGIAAGTGYVVSAAVGIVGLGLAIIGLVNLRR